MGRFHRFIPASAGVFFASVVTVGSAYAQLQSVDVGLNPTFNQTAAGVTSTGGFFSARAFFSNAGDYTTGSLVLSGGPTLPLADQGYSVPELGYGDSNGSFDALKASYLAPSYEFMLSGGMQGDADITMDYAGDAWSNAAALTQTSFEALQGMNAAGGLAIDFLAMVPAMDATSSDIVFSVSDATNSQVFSQTLSSSATSVTIPGGVLAPGSSYSFDLLFSDQIGGSVDGVTTTQFYDSHTGGDFYTEAAVPEASTWAMMLAGFAGLGAFARRFGGRSSNRRAFGANSVEAPARVLGLPSDLRNR